MKIKKNKKTKSMWETKQKIYGVPQGSSGKTLMATDLPQNCFNTSTDTAELVTQIIGQIIFFCEVIEFSNLVLIVCFFFSRTESLYWQHCKCDGRCNLSSITYFDRLQVWCCETNALEDYSSRTKKKCATHTVFQTAFLTCKLYKMRRHSSGKREEIGMLVLASLLFAVLSIPVLNSKIINSAPRRANLGLRKCSQFG